MGQRGRGGGKLKRCSCPAGGRRGCVTTKSRTPTDRPSPHFPFSAASSPTEEKEREIETRTRSGRARGREARRGEVGRCPRLGSDTPSSPQTNKRPPSPASLETKRPARVSRSLSLSHSPPRSHVDAGGQTKKWGKGFPVHAVSVSPPVSARDGRNWVALCSFASFFIFLLFYGRMQVTARRIQLSDCAWEDFLAGAALV
jgi:hypothetical protein